MRASGWRSPWSLRLRVLAVLLLSLVAVQLLSFMAVGWSRGSSARHLVSDMVAGDLQRVQAQLAAMPATDRGASLQMLDRAAYRWQLVDPALALPTDDDDAALGELARRLATADGAPRGRPVRWQAQGALRLPLDGTHDLLAVFPRGLPRSTPPLSAVLSYGLVVTAAVALAAWVAVGVATRPLARAAAAAREMSEHLPGPSLDEAGPPEVQELTRSLNALRSEVQRQLGARTRILAAVTHDLKTPITRMQLRVAALPDGEARRRLQADLDAMATLVAEGLAFAGSERLHEPLALVDLNALIENVVESMVDLGHECHYEPRPLPPVRAAPRALTRLVQNLVDNAVRYGGSAEVQAQVAGGHAELSVADRGPGLSEGDLERMFEPFVRGEPSRGRAQGGTGLGLAVARNLAQAHGGRLWLEPRAGGGLVARLRWPMEPVLRSG